MPRLPLWCVAFLTSGFPLTTVVIAQPPTPATPPKAAPPAVVYPLSRIAFGSCADQDKPLPIFDTMTNAHPDLLLMLGDNIYSDIKTPRDKVDADVIKRAYEKLASIPSWQKLRAATTLMAIWDDHDYGVNDSGSEWKFKDESKKLMLDFFGVPADSPRRSRAGAYTAAIVGPVGQRVQIILLDLRYFRTGLEKARMPYGHTFVNGYKPTNNPDAVFLGAEQWKWLEEQLQKPAEIRLICSGVQLISDEHPFEKWGNIPAEREKLYDLLRRTQAQGVIVLSGDRHMAELSVDTQAIGYPLYDATSSGFNQASQTWRAPEQNSKRVGGMPWGNNFGLIDIDWKKPDPLISLKLMGEDGETNVKAVIPLSILKPKADTRPKAALPAGAIGPRDGLRKPVGDAVTLQMLVQAGRKFPDKLLLNSEKNFRSPDNFTIVLLESALTEGKWKGANVDTFQGKTIRVTGTIAEYSGKNQIQVQDGKQIVVIE
ncbi:MAG: alkaline phosphatase family protein [Bacteroidales bacterium]|nr:alkaline phosphatase family protein [Bacteroidales bacterium]